MAKFIITIVIIIFQTSCCQISDEHIKYHPKEIRAENITGNGQQYIIFDQIK